MAKETSVKIGLFSRIDAGSVGYRRGLVREGFEIFREEGTHFNILLGGLVSKRAISRRLKNEILTLKEKAKKTAEETGEKPEKIDRVKVEHDYLNSLAEELAEAIPVMKSDKKLPRLYIMISPSYDGAYGEFVARKLTQLRPDIRYWEKTDEHFAIKRTPKQFLGLVPEKESWSSEYDSTPVDRLVKDHQRRTTQPLPDICGVGCFASSFYKPRGEAKRPYLSVPALHKLEQVRTSENQIGVVVLEICPEEAISEVKRTYNLKDLVGRERDSIPIPKNCSSTQRAIIAALKEKGALTVGLLSDATGIPRDNLSRALSRMLESPKFQSMIHYDEASRRYDFDLEWIQKNLFYGGNYSRTEWTMDALLGFGCLHAGSIHTDYQFFVDKLPEVILQNGVNTLAGDGDFIEGLKHHLIERGEVFGGFDYTTQEKLAAHLVSEVMVRVFEERFGQAWNARKNENPPSDEELESMVSGALITFIYREGNHDDWMQDIGVAPLAIFRYELVNCLNRAIADILKAKDYYLRGLNGIIESRVQKTEIYILPSGISLEMFHLHMARAKTTTLRLQETFSKSNCHVVLLANFHVATSMERWDPEVGQRVGMQFGTIVRETQFEENKGKKVDIGVGYLRIFSKNQKIMMSEEFFVIPAPSEGLRNDEILKTLESKIGMRFVRPA